MAPSVLIVARDRPRLYEQAKAKFGARGTTDVILDRRVEPRRQRYQMYYAERRRGVDRRARPQVDAELRSVGYTMVYPRIGPDGRETWVEPREVAELQETERLHKLFGTARPQVAKRPHFRTNGAGGALAEAPARAVGVSAPQWHRVAIIAGIVVLVGAVVAAVSLQEPPARRVAAAVIEGWKDGDPGIAYWKYPVQAKVLPAVRDWELIGAGDPEGGDAASDRRRASYRFKIRSTARSGHPLETVWEFDVEDTGSAWKLVGIRDALRRPRGDDAQLEYPDSDRKAIYQALMEADERAHYEAERQAAVLEPASRGHPRLSQRQLTLYQELRRKYKAREEELYGLSAEQSAVIEAEGTEKRWFDESLSVTDWLNPLFAPPGAGPRPPAARRGLGVTSLAVKYSAGPAFTFEPGPAAHGEPHYLGRSRDGHIMLQLVGPGDDLVAVSLTVFASRNLVLPDVDVAFMHELLRVVAPGWDEARRWLTATLDDFAKRPKTGEAKLTERIERGDRQCVLHVFKDLGAISLTLARKR